MKGDEVAKVDQLTNMWTKPLQVLTTICEDSNMTTITL